MRTSLSCRNAIRFLVWVITSSWFTVAGADNFPAVYDSPSEANLRPLSATEAAATFALPDGFHVSVFAAEPEVQNPIGMAWDTHGRLWVAENYTYSDRTQRFDLSLRDRVVVFEDHDNDGHADSRRIFSDSLQMLTSVETGHGGVWLMCPPQLLFIPDANQDAIPDGPAQVMLDGFEVAQDNYHNFANGLRWGPDGWLYGRCGHSCPGRLGIPGTPDEARVPIDGGIWRFHPKRKVVEVLCHGTVNPWGHDWDTQGELFFINTVIGHVWHMMPGAHFIESFGQSRNPDVYERMDMIADHYHYDRNQTWSESRYGRADDFGGGHAHIGMMICQGNHWPARYQQKLFTLNMHGQRANVERLERQGAGYVARHAPDLFTTKDPFFRGLEIQPGPDGNVFVLDWSDTGECHEHNGVHRTSGRIYKISYGAARRPGPVVKPACLAGEGKLPELWRQYQAEETSPAMLRALLTDPDPHVRAWAIRLLTDTWPLDTVVGPRPGAEYPDDPETRHALSELAYSESTAFVRLVLASTLQRFPVSHRAQLAANLLQHTEDGQDRDLPYLVWYGLMPLAEQDPQRLAQLAIDCQWPPTVGWISRSLALRTRSNPVPLNKLLTTAPDQPLAWQQAVLQGMRDAYRGWRHAPLPAAWDSIRNTKAAAESPQLVRELSSLFGDGRALAELRQLVADTKSDLQVRRDALQSLVDARPDDLRALCESLLKVRVVNGAALSGLAVFDDREVGRTLADHYRYFHPDDRPQLMETLASRPNFALALLDAIQQEQSRLQRSDITTALARRMHQLGNSTVNTKLTEVWGELHDASADHHAVIQKLREQLTNPSDRAADLPAGRRLFEKTCAGCHVLFGAGKKVGPDLTGTQRGNLDYLLEHIVSPSAVVDRDYRMTVVVTHDGRTLSGLVVSKDEATMVLQTATNQQTLPLEDIDEWKSTSLSAMPEGLLDEFSAQQLQDLFGYLRHPVQVPLSD